MNINFKSMTDMGIFTTVWEKIWSDPIGWFLEFPLFSQVLIIIGLIALTIAALVLVYLRVYIFSLKPFSPGSINYLKNCIMRYRANQGKKLKR